MEDQIVISSLSKEIQRIKTICDSSLPVNVTSKEIRELTGISVETFRNRLMCTCSELLTNT